MLLIFIVYLALEDRNEFYLVAAFVCGLLLDFASNLFLGSFALAFLFGAAALRVFIQKVVAMERNWKYLPLVLISAQATVYFWIFFYNALAVRLGYGANLLAAKQFFTHFFAEAFYNLILLYPVWKLAGLPEKLQAKFSPRVW